MLLWPNSKYVDWLAYLRIRSKEEQDAMKRARAQGRRGGRGKL